MEIRKEFRYEMGHIVRNAWSRRCSKNVHGHSYRVEFFFKGNECDNGQMLLDFGFIKQYLAPYVDAFDHSFWLWDRPEDVHIKEFFTANFERVITSSFSTTAEMQAKLFYTYANSLLRALYLEKMFENGEGSIYCSKVVVHETTTGYAEYSGPSLHINESFPNIKLKEVIFSPFIIDEWSTTFTKLYSNIIKYENDVE